MFREDKDALICDLAETYHIYDYKSLPITMVATFSVGLRNDSRIKMKMNNMKHPFETVLMATAVDRLSMILWSKTKNAQKGVGKPESIVAKLLDEDNREIMAFNSPEEFERKRMELMQEGD